MNTMKKLQPAFLSALVLLTGAVSFASEAEPTATEVEAARRCAIATKEAGRSFGAVRDNLQVGGGSRAEELLSVAENALLDARSACRDNAEITASLEDLAGEAERIRRSLSAAPKP